MVEIAEWEPYGPALNVIEDVAYEGFGRLGCSYTDNVDTRWYDQICLGPLVTTIDCGAAGGTAANANGAVRSHGMNATEFLHVIRGTKWAKINLNTRALVSDGSETALAEAATDIIYTKNAAGTEEISIGMAGTAYQVISAVGNGATDTHAANTDSQVIRIFGHMGGESSSPRIGGLSGSTVYQNTIASGTTMGNGNWVTRAILPSGVTPTSLELDGPFWIIGTDEGPMFLNNDFQTFRLLIPEIMKDSENCRAMRGYSFVGLVVDLSTGTRYMKNVETGGSCGPETYWANTSPVGGRMTALAASERWGYMAIYNIVDDVTYICAFRPRQPTDWHPNVFSYYPLIKLTTECKFMEFTDKAGGVTSPTFYAGSDDDVIWWLAGRTSTDIEDSAYTFAASGTWYGTTLQRHKRFLKGIEFIELETSNCTANQTVTVKVSIDGGTAVQVGAPIASDGMHRIEIPKVDGRRSITGRRLQPQLDFATNSSSASPRVIGTIRVGYERYPLEVDGREYA